MTKQTPILADLQARGLVSQTTNGLEEHLSQARTLYCGFDPTADSLHIGSLVPLLTLRRFQQAGHTPLILVGGATGMIGDPSFKAQERKLNTAETVREWTEKLKRQTSRIVPNATVVNNFDWTHTVSILDFLRDIGKHFTVNNLIAKDAIKSRLEREGEGISFTEFTYPLLQGFDFQQLLKAHNCSVQIGGSDQWGNMTAGTELIRKTMQAESHVMTLPLVTKADGTKFGKTESGTIWLDASKTSPYAFYQFWLNTADADVEKFLLYFSLKKTPSEIVEIMSEHNQDAGKRRAQTILAVEITTLVHGAEATLAVQRISNALFTGSPSLLEEQDFQQIAQDGLPTTNLEADGIVDGLITSKLASSKREARDFLKGKAVYHNGQLVEDETFTLTPQNAAYGKYHLLRRGKKNYALLVHEEK